MTIGGETERPSRYPASETEVSGAPRIADGPWWEGCCTISGVAVVHVDLQPHAVRQREATRWLDREELFRLEMFRFAGADRRFIFCRSALRAILSYLLDCPNNCISFDATSFGKPFVTVSGVPAPLRFNVAHSGGHGLIAFSWDREVGVDVEERHPRRHLEGLIDTVMAPVERAKLLSLAEDRRLRLFYRVWTMKEALAKAYGTGLHTDFAKFQVPEQMLLGGVSDEFRFAEAPQVPWTLVDLGNVDFAAALAYETRPSSLDADHAIIYSRGG